MMKSITIVTKTIRDVFNRANVKSLLTELSDNDDDFSGHGFRSTICDEAAEAGFDSDAEYYAHKATELIEDPKRKYHGTIYEIHEMIGLYLQNWMENSENTSENYEEYEYDVITVEGTMVITLAYLS